MLAAAGLAATWVFKKARILAIFDDLDTVLLMIPLKILLVGFKWQLSAVIFVIVVLLWLAWRYLHAVKWPVSWAWVLFYAAVLTIVSELIYLSSKVIDATVPVHLEVLLPAFVLGCVLAHSSRPLNKLSEEKASGIITGFFMVLVGLSMPAIGAGESTSVGITGETLLGGEWPGWGLILLHVLIITVLSNLGKMFSLLCYRKEATFKERLALSVAMFPRGEVGAGVLVVSLGYGLGGPAVTIAMLSLALNLLCTGFFISYVKRLIPVKEAAA
jgi:Kef-type K+ transport system membrane component KefB